MGVPKPPIRRQVIELPKGVSARYGPVSAANTSRKQWARTRAAMHNSWDKNDPKDAQVILHMLKAELTQTWHYTTEYRANHPLARGGGRTVNDLASEFEASANVIRYWLKQASLDEGLRSGGLTTAVP
jgi:hypothetical protein